MNLKEDSEDVKDSCLSFVNASATKEQQQASAPPRKRRKLEEAEAPDSSPRKIAGETPLTRASRSQSRMKTAQMISKHLGLLYPSKAMDEKLQSEENSQLTAENNFLRNEVQRLRSMFSENLDVAAENAELKMFIATKKPLDELHKVESERDALEDKLDRTKWDMWNEEKRRNVELYNAKCDASREFSNEATRIDYLRKLQEKAVEKLKSGFEAQLQEQREEYEERLLAAFGESATASLGTQAAQDETFREENSTQSRPRCTEERLALAEEELARKNKLCRKLKGLDNGVD